MSPIRAPEVQVVVKSISAGGISGGSNCGSNENASLCKASRLFSLFTPPLSNVNAGCRGVLPIGHDLVDDAREIGQLGEIAKAVGHHLLPGRRRRLQELAITAAKAPLRAVPHVQPRGDRVHGGGQCHRLGN